MSNPRLILKRSSGWFAAGREFADVLPILSDGAFKLYVYVCLHADRRTARIPYRPDDIGAALGKERKTIEMHLSELKNQDVCRAHPEGSIEISDRFWPYQKQKVSTGSSPEETEFIRSVRDLFLEPSCVQATFTAADHSFAARLFERRVPIEQVRRAILLGCARKYVALINHQMRHPITSLQYFAALVDEVGESNIPEGYWEPLRRRVLVMETRWLAI